MNTKASNNPVIFFDGICNLCNASVIFIIRHDKRGRFKFASLQSEFAKDFLKKHALLADARSLPDSLILVQENKIYFKSEAAVEIAKQLSGIWKFFVVFGIIPRPLRDRLYDVVARNRYKWFGKRQSCMVPASEISERFF
jgi:predicted DCC family thiol-disulfide oxidoreductase YuxK